MKNLILISTLVMGSFSLKANEGYSGHYFTNYNSSTDGITSNSGFGVAFAPDGNVGYATMNDGLSIGTLSNGVYTFTNYNSTNSNLSSNDIRPKCIAFDNNNAVIVATEDEAGNGTGLDIGTLTNNNYSFTHYDTNNGLSGDNGTSVSFAPNGGIGYTDESSGLDIGVKSGSSYTWTNYNSDNPNEITDSEGQEIAFNNNGDVAYASSFGGLDIGTKTDSGYTWRNYNSGNPNEITSDDGLSVAFDNNGDIAYTSYGGLDIGIKNGTTYTWTNYNATNPNQISGDQGINVAFDGDGDVAYVPADGDFNGLGLDIGIKQNDGSYSFTNYGAGAVSGLDGEGVAFNNAGDVGYASDGGGLDIGNIFNMQLDQNSPTYQEVNGGLEINNLAFDLNFGSARVINQKTGNYIFVAVIDQSVSSQAEYIHYITNNGLPIQTPGFEIPQTDSSIANDNRTLSLSGIYGENGYNIGDVLNIEVAIGNTNDAGGINDAIITNTTSLTINEPSSDNNLAVGLGVGLGVGIPVVGGAGAVGGLAYYAKVNKLSFVEASRKIGAKFKVKK